MRWMYKKDLDLQRRKDILDAIAKLCLVEHVTLEDLRLMGIE